MASNPTISRRQALRMAITGSVAVASCVVALSGPLALTIFAGQPTPTALLGVRTGTIPAGGPASAIPVVVESMDPTTNRVQILSVAQMHRDGTPVLFVSETISAFARLTDGTFLLAITPLPGTSQSGRPMRLTRLTQSSAITVPSSGLSALEQAASLLLTSDGRLLGLVGRRNGRPPNRIVQIDPQSASISDYANVQLPAGQRYQSLAQCPDGQLYSTIVENSGATSLVNLNTGSTVPLTFQGDVWNNGLASLVCSASNQLFALGAPRGSWPNGVYVVDAAGGSMIRIGDFDVASLTLARA